MAKRISRRGVLRCGLALVAGLGLSLGGIALMQDQTPAPDPKALSSLELTGSVRRVHDPSIIRAGDAYYVFSTGQGIQIRKSADLLDWEMPFPARVFANMPDWAQEKIPGQADIWAPDISFFNGKYHLYYSVSTFGKNRSVIGLATNTTLDSDDENYEWVDEGMVVESFAADNHNAIDPNLIIDADGVPWLAYGSFWTGLKMRRLDYDTGKPSEEDTTLYNLAQRRVNNGAVEAPFIIRKGDFYYLFASFDSCCRGADSTYYVVVGRSENVTGPYVDRDGVEMLDGGGTQVTFPTERWRGPGHNSILQENGVEYIVYHAYDADNQGLFSMRIDPLVWDDEGWPSINGMKTPADA